MPGSIHTLLESTDTDQNARRLLGCELVRTTDQGTIRAVITETESYDQNDSASHSYGRITKRNQVMYGPAGHAYVYLSYGMHFCLNVVTGPADYGSGVLIRGVKIIEGHALAQKLRGDHIKPALLSNGPGKVGQVLQIDLHLYGHDLATAPLQLVQRPPVENILSTPRIGISRNKDALRRFVIAPATV